MAQALEAYLDPRRVMLWLSSKATYPRGLNSLDGICPCLTSWGRAHGAHLATQAREDQIVLHGSYGAANLLSLGRYRSARGASLLERRDAIACDAVARCLSALLMVTDKPTLRAEMRRLRKRLAEANPSAAGRASEHAGDLPSSDVIALYRAMGSELDTDAVAVVLVAAGRTLCLPVVLERDMAMIFRRWSPGEPLEMDVAGCPAPLPLAETVTPDLILAPLLAFDDFGGRLGQGGGYYDRTFATLHDAVRVGFAYAGQRVDRIPMEAHDQPLHGVLTEVGYMTSLGISR